jgi:hypothetical protein
VITGLKVSGDTSSFEPVGDSPAVLVELGELRVLEVLVELALRQLDAAPGLGDDREVREQRQRRAQSFEDEDLARRVGQVLLGADDVGDRHLDVVDDARQVIEAGAVGALDHMVGLRRPLAIDRAAHQIVDAADAVARHLEPHRRGPALGFESCPLGRGLGCPAAARDIGALRRLGLGALGLGFFGTRVVAVGNSRSEELLDRRLIERQALGLVVGRVRPADLGPFVPVDPQPTETVEDRGQRIGQIPLRVGVVDPQDELAAMAAGEEPVEQRRAHPADVQVTGGRGGEANAGSCRRRSGEGHSGTLFGRREPARRRHGEGAREARRIGGEGGIRTPDTGLPRMTV